MWMRIACRCRRFSGRAAYFFAELLSNAANKVLRRLLRDAAVEGTAADSFQRVAQPHRPFRLHLDGLAAANNACPFHGKSISAGPIVTSKSRAVTPK